MLNGALITLAVVALVAVLAEQGCRAWLGSRGFIAERVRIELEQREAERQIQHLAYAAMQRMVEEVRREQRP